MAVKKSQLYSSLWASCDKLRGGMDASQYKDYILTLLFVKYVSDKYKNDPYGAIAIPDGASFEDLVALKGNKNIGEEIDKLIAKLAEANNLTGIINNAHFNDESKIGKGDEMVDKLTDLIAIFQKPELDFKNNKAEDDDLIGDAYEYLMRNFATASGKSKGQFYTPAEVSRILAKMNVVLHNIPSGEIHSDNIFSDPWYKDDNDDTKLRKFDYIVANLPFSMKNWMDGLKPYGRFDDYDELPPEKNGDYAWLLHIIKSMKNNTGKAAVILPHGVLFRGNAEESIRKNIIDRHLIKGIIGLPANLFYGTGIPACIIVLDKENTASRTGIFMIDASHGFIKDGDKNRLREQDIYKIVTTFNSMTEVPGFSRFVPFAEIIEKNAYNLNIPRYIDSSEKEDLQSIEAHLYGGIPQEDIDNIPHFWNVFPNLKKEIFGEYKHESCHAEFISASETLNRVQGDNGNSASPNGFYKLLIQKDDVHKTITENAEFLEYNKKVNKAFEEWKTFANPILTNLKPADSNKEIILKLSEEILSKFTKLELIDKYDVYQVLLAYWNETMNDDVLLVIQDELGYKLAKVTDDIKEEPKESKKSKKDSAKEKKPKEPKVIGWEGRLIPKQIVLDAFFEAEQKGIEEAEEKLSQTENEFEEFVEENCVDDAEDDELSQEPEILKKCKAYESSIKSQKKTIADLKKKLDENCRKRYDTFTDTEITDLLVNRKWYKTIDQGIQNLYVTVANHLTKRIVQLYERYENTLPELTEKLAEEEKEVAAHLAQMGFKL